MTSRNDFAPNPGLLPLEAMVIGDRTLALRRVTFAFHVCRDGGHVLPPVKRSPADRLRILAVFSLPSGTTALALRRERVALIRLLERVGGDIELRVLQDGTNVTYLLDTDSTWQALSVQLG